MKYVWKGITNGSIIIIQGMITGMAIIIILCIVPLWWMLDILEKIEYRFSDEYAYWKRKHKEIDAYLRNYYGEEEYQKMCDDWSYTGKEGETQKET